VIFSLLFLLNVFVVSTAHATYYWAGPSGDNAAACLDIDSTAIETDPLSYGTINRAAVCATAAGDTIVVKAGTYTGVNNRIKTDSNCTGTCLASGTSVDNMTTIRGAPGEAIPVIRIGTGDMIAITPQFPRNWIKIQDLTFDGLGQSGADCTLNLAGQHIIVDTVTVKNSYNHNICGFGTTLHSLTVRNSTLTGAGGGGPEGAPGDGNGYSIYYNGDNLVFEHNVCGRNRGGCVHAFAEGTPNADNAIIRYNWITGVQTSTASECFGMVTDGTPSQIYGNILDGSSCSGVGNSYGIWTIAGSASIYNNLIYEWNGAGIQVTSTSGTVARNNILFGNTSGISGAITSTHNACTAATTCGSSKITITALTDITVSTSDFRHKAGSLGINAGTTSIGTRACNGVCDLGPFETIGFSTATIDLNTMDVTLGMSVNTPLLPASGITGFTVGCTGVGCGTPVVASAARKSGADSVVRLTISGIVGDACDASQTWTVTYSGTGNLTDSQLLGNTANQGVSAFAAQPVTETCSGSSTPPPAGLHIHYKLDDGSGTNANDETANPLNLDGTLTNGPTWTATAHTDGGVTTTDATNQRIAVPYGSGVNPSTHSLTIAVGVLVDATVGANARFYLGATSGTNQRFHVATNTGTWRLGIQSSSASASASNLSVTAGWTRLCLVMDSGADTATLYVNGVAGTGGAAKAYTSYTLASNISVGSPFDTNESPGTTYDEFKVWTSVESCADDYAAWEQVSPTPTGTYEQKTHKWQRLRNKADGSAEDFTISGITNGITMSVMVGGAIALITQIDCTGANCDPTGARLYYSRNGGTFIQVPDIFSSDGVRFYGTPDVDVVSGTVECCLTGALTENDGPTNTTASAIPLFDLDQNASFVRRSILKFDPSVSDGDSYCFKEYHQTDIAMDAYTPSGGACVTIVGVSAGIGF
jgi:hypothetical protein